MKRNLTIWRCIKMYFKENPIICLCKLQSFLLVCIKLRNQECLQNVKDFCFVFSLTFFDSFPPSKQAIFSKEMKLKETCEKTLKLRS